MTGSSGHSSDASKRRYKRLSQLVARYERGEITHQEFEQIKTAILFGVAIPAHLQTVRVEMILATFSDLNALNSTLNDLREMTGTRRGRIIDSAAITKDVSGVVRLRSIAGPTRLREAGKLSIVVSLSSLLFPGQLIEIPHAGSMWIQNSLRYMEQLGVSDDGLRRLGCGLSPGSQSIVVIYWSSVADEVASRFRGFQRFVRRIQTEAVAGAITAALDESPAKDPLGRLGEREIGR